MCKEFRVAHPTPLFLKSASRQSGGGEFTSLTHVAHVQGCFVLWTCLSPRTKLKDEGLCGLLLPTFTLCRDHPSQGTRTPVPAGVGFLGAKLVLGAGG